MGRSFFRFVACFSVFLFIVLLASPGLQAGWKDGQPFPLEPHGEMTPGSTCTRPNAQRYAERINYCNRNVSSSLKARVFENYSRLGFELLDRFDRAEFKIDHYIPLCMGGSNDEDNLWPQHRHVYEVTDPLEQVACEKMAQGKLLQRDAIHLIRQGKADLGAVDKIFRQIQSL